MELGKDVSTVTIRKNRYVTLYLYYRNELKDSIWTEDRVGDREQAGIYYRVDDGIHEISFNKHFKFEIAKYQASAPIVRPCFSKQYIILMDEKTLVFVYDRKSKKLLPSYRVPMVPIALMLMNTNRFG